MGCFMYQYPKQILTIAQQVQSYIDAGMVITSREDVEKALKSVGFYRLRGYSFQLYDNATKKYISGTKFEDILKLYQFDQELSVLTFSMISKIEVALRVRLVEALLIHREPLVLQDSSIFKEKKLYWQNMSTVASEIARSNDVFIKHNFDNHDGEVPVWAAVEVLSFGTLSKIIKIFLQFFNCLLVIFLLRIEVFLNQYFPFSISLSVNSTDIILFLQGLHNSFYGAKRSSYLCSKLFLLNGRILVNQSQNGQFF